MKKYKIFVFIISLFTLAFLSMPSDADIANSVVNGTFNVGCSDCFIDTMVGWTEEYGEIIYADPIFSGISENSSVFKIFGFGDAAMFQNFTAKGDNLNFSLDTPRNVYVNATDLNTSTLLFNVVKQTGSYSYNISSSKNHVVQLEFKALNDLKSGDTFIFDVFNNYTVTFDPSGFVKDQNSNPVSNVRVDLSNATFNATPAYSNSAGFWSTNIFADGTYNLKVSKQGYTTLTGSQVFAVGGVNNNFTIVGSQGVITGHVYTTLSGTGTTSIRGNLQDLRTDSCGIVQSSGLINLGNPGDGSTYLLRLKDVDSGNQQSSWTILKDGTIIDDNILVNTNDPTQEFIFATFFETVFVDIRVSNVFQGGGGELNTATTCGSFEHVRKSIGIIDFLVQLAQDVLLGATLTGSSGATTAAFSDVFLSTDNTNQNAVFFNSTVGKDDIGYADFTVNNPATIFNFNVAITAESTTANAGKIELGYTDNTLSEDNGFTDIILINSRQSCQANMNGYCAPQHDFKSLDANGDGTIRVWFKFDSGHSNFKLYEFYLNAWGTTTKVPLPGAAVYSANATNASTTTDLNGAYSLLVPLTNNTIFYTKIGYESKNYTFVINSSVNYFTQDVTLNLTNATSNTTKEYIVVPNFVQGTATNGNFKTLAHNRISIPGIFDGSYQIAICPQLGGDCTTQDVPANTESTFAVDPNLPIGTYQADLTGFLGGLLDIGRDVIVSTNFTVTSDTPRVDWANGAAGYFLGDKMVVEIYVPSSSQVVQVTYLTNGTLIYNNSFSATGTVQNVSFQTNNNVSLSAFQPGTYQACITGGNCVTTTLFNVSNSDYQLSSPANVNWGEKFNILWKAPHTATLQISNLTNIIISSQSVPVGNSLEGITTVDTTFLPNQADNLTISLTRNNQIVAKVNTAINQNSNPGASGQSADTSQLVALIQSKMFIALLITAGIMIAIIWKRR